MAVRRVACVGAATVSVCGSCRRVYSHVMADDYERGHMTGVGEVLHREKVTTPRAIFAFVASIPLVLAIPGAVTLVGAGGPLAAAAALGAGVLLSLALGALMLVFASVRLVVSEGEVSIQLGFAGPRVAVADIASVSRGFSGTRSYGLGVMRDFAGMTTTVKMLGDNDRAIHIHKRDGSKLVIVTKEPDALFAALSEALARRDAALPRVRVEEPADDASVEAEADAEETARAARRGSVDE